MLPAPSADLARAEQQAAQGSVELVQLFALEMAGAAVDLDGQRVDRAAVLSDFEMDVGAGRQTRRADPADELALADDFADPRGDAAHVAVAALNAAAVRELDLLAVAAVPPSLQYPAIGRGEDRSTGGGGEVDSGMEALVAEDRVEAVAEARGHPPVNREAHARAVLPPYPVGVDPDDAAAVGPLEQF